MHKPLTNGRQNDQRTGIDLQPRFSKIKEPALNHLIFDDTCGFFEIFDSLDPEVISSKCLKKPGIKGYLILKFKKHPKLKVLIISKNHPTLVLSINHNSLKKWFIIS
jgi:hypothetical protein